MLQHENLRSPYACILCTASSRPCKSGKAQRDTEQQIGLLDNCVSLSDHGERDRAGRAERQNMSVHAEDQNRNP